MKNYGDICTIDGGLAEPVDCIIGGSPCQNLSIAGNRLGLEGNESSLFLEQIRVVQEMRKATNCSKPRYMVWENVQGALSCSKGKDFQAVLDLCVRTCVIPKERESYDYAENNEGKNETYSETTVPHVPMPKNGKWPNAGVLYDDLGRWSLAWRVHDAQFWGVAQRRRRLALVVDFGGMSAPEVLFERQGVSGNTEQNDAQGEGTSRATDACITEPAEVWDARGNGNLCSTITGDHDNRITDYTNVVVEKNGLPVYCIGNGQVHDALSPSVELSKTLNCLIDPMKIVLPVVENDRVKSEEPWLLESNQNHATVTNTGVSTTLPASMGMGGGYVPMITERAREIEIDAFSVHQNSRNELRTSQIAYALTAEQGAKPDQSLPVIAYKLVSMSSNSMKSSNPHSGCYKTEVAGTIVAGGCTPNNQGCLCIVERDVSPTLISAIPGGVCAPTYCVGNGQAHVTEHYTEELSQTLNCMHEPMQIATPREAGRYVVRRLTPLECTRLQGYPDGWVDIGDWTDTKGKKHKDADTPKYKALGNSIALPFWRWLCQNIITSLQAQGNAFPTMASLFDGIGGFPLCWNSEGGRTVWISEIDEFPIAVTRKHFAE